MQYLSNPPVDHSTEFLGKLDWLNLAEAEAAAMDAVAKADAMEARAVEARAVAMRALAKARNLREIVTLKRTANHQIYEIRSAEVAVVDRHAGALIAPDHNLTSTAEIFATSSLSIQNTNRTVDIIDGFAITSHSHKF